MVKVHLLKLSAYGIWVCAKVAQHHLCEMHQIMEEVEFKAKPKTNSLSPSSQAQVVLGTTSYKMESLVSKKRKRALEKAFNLTA